MDNYFLYNVNRTIGDNMRFARQFQAQQQMQAGMPVQQPADPYLGFLHPIIFMMMFMMTQMAQQMGVNLPEHPYLPGGVPSGPGQPQNPALTYLLDKLGAKAAAAPTAERITFEQADVDALRAKLQAGDITEAQLGQALKFLMVEAEDKFLPAISRAIGDLVDSGHLNVVPFLQNAFLEKLSDLQADTLMQTVKRAGFRLEDGRPNSRFVAHLIDSLHRDGQSATRAFTHQFLQEYYDAHKEDLDSPIGKILTQVLELGNVTAEKDGTLVFP